MGVGVGVWEGEVGWVGKGGFVLGIGVLVEVDDGATTFAVPQDV